MKNTVKKFKKKSRSKGFMDQKANSKFDSPGGDIYTLGQMRTDNSEKSVLMIKGEGSDITNSKVLNARAKKKLITNVLTLKLIKLAEKKGDAELAQSFRNTFHCLDEMIVENGKMHAEYCKNRFCLVCNSYRKASLINSYLPTVSKWDDAQFVTLTIRSVSAKDLDAMLDRVLKEFKKIINKYAKKYQRSNGIKLIGLRTIECNFNPIKRTYNPHLHIIVASKEMAEIIIKEWLCRWGKKHTVRVAQFIRKVEDSERDLIEIIKYNTKIFTEPKDRTISMSVYVRSIYNIIVAMKRQRIIERFGFNLPRSEKDKEKVITSVVEYDKVNYSLKHTDWINEETGELLSSFELDPELRDLLKNKIDTSLE